MGGVLRYGLKPRTFKRVALNFKVAGLLQFGFGHRILLLARAVTRSNRAAGGF